MPYRLRSLWLPSASFSGFAEVAVQPHSSIVYFYNPPVVGTRGYSFSIHLRFYKGLGPSAVGSQIPVPLSILTDY